MTITHWLRHAKKLLEDAGIMTARLDCLVLMEDVLHTNRTQLLAQPEREITDEDTTILSIALEKRAQHIPLAYIRGKTEFYGREFMINEDVLEPRPESETMIEMLKQLTLPANPRIADIGAGSGALGITAALELRSTTVDLIDIDKKALAVARHNAKQYQVNAHCIEQDLLTGRSAPYDVLLCNLPYVPDGFKINTAALHEPRIAIFGGEDGLHMYRKLFKQLAGQVHLPRYVLTEALPFQHNALAAIAAEHGYRLEKTEDFIQQFRDD